MCFKISSTCWQLTNLVTNLELSFDLQIYMTNSNISSSMILDLLLTGLLYSSYSTWTHSSHQICIVFTFPISVKWCHYSPTCSLQKLGNYLRYISLINHTQSIPVLCLVTQSCLPLCNPMDCNPPGSSIHGDSPGKNTRVDCHALLQGIFPIQGLNPGLLHYRWFFTIWAPREIPIYH